MSAGSAAISSVVPVLWIGFSLQTPKTLKKAMDYVQEKQPFLQNDAEIKQALQFVVAKATKLYFDLRFGNRDCPGFWQFLTEIHSFQEFVTNKDFKAQSATLQQEYLVRRCGTIWAAASQMISGEYRECYRESCDQLMVIGLPTTPSEVVNRIKYVVYVILHSYWHLGSPMELPAEQEESEGIKAGTLRPAAPTQPPAATAAAKSHALASAKLAPTVASKTAPQGTKGQKALSAAAKVDTKPAAASKKASQGTKGQKALDATKEI